MRSILNKKDIYNAFKNLNLISSKVVIHSSLSSLGYIDGGADDVIDVCLNSFKTIMMPAFCWDSNCPPPKEDMPLRNGCDYAFYDNWDKPLKPFDIRTAGIEKSMGIISKKFLSIEDVRRSNHAWHSWAAWGDYSDKIIENHLWSTTNLPIERLAEIGGHVVLLGVNLSSCTAIHTVEEKIGRNSFIRWAVDKDGFVKRVRASGCSKGFNNLMTYCNNLFNEITVGNCRILTVSLDKLINHLKKVILNYPEITRCSTDCIKCRDLIEGGPIEN